MSAKIFNKRNLRLMIVLLATSLLCIGARADGETSALDDRAATVDDFLSGLFWTAEGSAHSLSLLKENTDGCLSFSGSSGGESDPAAVWRAFDPPLDLYYYRTLRTAVEITVKGKTNLPYYAELTLHSGETTESSRIQILSGKKAIVDFDLSAYKSRGAVDGMELRFYEAAESASSQSFSCKIYKIEAAGGADRQLSERFMADAYLPSGAAAEFSSDKSTLTVQSSQNDCAIEGKITVKPTGDFTNALRIVMSNDTRSTSMRVYYTYGEDEGYSDERSATVEIKRATDPVSYIVPIAETQSIKKLKIVFTGNSKGTLVISSIAAVCAYTDRTDKIGAISTCAVSDDGRYIVIKGSVRNENTTAYRDCTLALYELSSYEEPDAILKRTTLPTSTHSMSTKFEFKLPLSAANHSSILSKYVVVLYKNGAVIQPLILVDGPKYVSNTAQLAPDVPASQPSNTFKGIQTAYLSGAQEAGVGQVVIDVEINRLLSAQSSGYLHLMSGKYIYFDSDYVNALDREIRAYTASGTDVLLNLVITQGNEKKDYVYSDTLPDVKYYALNVSNLQGELYAGAVVDFLSLRYNGSAGMAIGGFILGKKIDLPSEYNAMGSIQRLDVYAKNYIRALRLVYTTAQSRNPHLRVYAPLSDAWRQDVPYGILAQRYDTTLLLDAMTNLIAAEGAFEWRLLCHSTRNAFGLYEGDTLNINYDAKARASASMGYIGTDSIETLVGFLNGLNEKYRAAPGGTLYFWQPDIAKTGSYLAPLYAYNYYKLLSTVGVEGFVVSFNVFGSQSGDGHSFLSLKNQMKYIDTERSVEITSQNLSAFEATGWEEAIPGFYADRFVLRKLSEVDLSTNAPTGIKGSYDHWDFSGAANSQGWMPGEHCDSLTVATTELNEKALLCALNGGASEYGEFMGIYHTYPYPEDLSLTPWLTFDFRATCTDGSETKLEVVVVIGAGSDRIEAKAIVNSGERVILTMDLSSFGSRRAAEYIKIWVRGAGSGLENATLELYKVTGHSQNYDSSSLAKAIADARKKASDNNPLPASNGLFWGAIISGALLISVICFLALGRKKSAPVNKG